LFAAGAPTVIAGVLTVLAGVLTVVAGVLTVLAGVLTVVAGATTTGTRIVGVLGTDVCEMVDLTSACGAGSGDGCEEDPTTGAFWGAGSEACPRVAAVAPAAAGQPAATRTRIIAPQMRATM